MHDKIIFGSRDAMWLMMNMVCAKLALNAIRVLEETAGNASWLLCIYLIILANIGLFLVFKLFERFPGKDIIDIAYEVSGSPGRIIVGLTIVLTQLFVILLFFRGYAEHTKIVALTVSPISFITSFFIICMVIACFFGLEPLVRLHSIIIPLVAVLFSLILMLSLPQCQFENLLPVLGLGADKIFLGGTLKLSIFQELTFLFLLPPFLVSFNKFKSAGYKFINLSGFFYLSLCLVFGTIFPYSAAIESIIPVYSVSRVIFWGRLIQRIESIFFMMWSLASVFFLSASMYFIIYSFAKTLKLPYIKPLIIPFAIIIFTITLLPQRLLDVTALVEYYYNLGWAPAFVLPLILLIISILFRKGGKQNAQT
ncbi:MAG: GerAB/ArcD/ProY family transporter [Ignavibacteriales bacterium]